MPGEPEQDRGRPVRPPAHRAAALLRELTIPAVFVVLGPSGTGKGTLIDLALRSLPRVVTSVSATTRAPRAGEVDGTHYRFLSPREFRRAADEGRFIEWADYGGNLYGTLRDEVEGKLGAGYDVILEIDLQGARAIRAAMPDATLVFVAPPSLEELGRRLRGRATDAEAAIARRLEIARGELAAAHEFDEVIVNDDVEQAAARLVAIIAGRRAADKRRKGD